VVKKSAQLLFPRCSSAILDVKNRESLTHFYFAASVFLLRDEKEIQSRMYCRPTLLFFFSLLIRKYGRNTLVPEYFQQVTYTECAWRMFLIFCVGSSRGGGGDQMLLRQYVPDDVGAAT